VGGPSGADRPDEPTGAARELAERDDSASQRSSALRRAFGSWLALAEEAAERVPGPCYAMMHGSAQRWAPPPAVKVRAVADPIRWFDAERSALVAEVAHACDLRFNEYGWDLAATMERYLDLRGLYDDWRHMHERVLALCKEMGDKRGEAVLLRGLLEVITWTSPAESGPAMSQMRRLAARLLELFVDLEDMTGTVDAMVASVWGMVADGENRAALARAESALRVALEADYVGGKARALHVMAVAHRDGDPHAAVECLERAMVVAKQLGNPRFDTTIVQLLGAARVLCGDLEGGRILLDESIVMARELDDRYLETFSLLYLAKLFFATGDERARPTLELALTYCQTGNYHHHLADALGVLGEMNLADGDVPGAIACLTRSVQVWRTRGWIPCLARTLRTLGDAHAAIDDHEAARTSWTEARELFERIDDDAGRGSAEKRLTSERLVG
jgi:tetratricopeptide (TPR) repeat protein